MMTERKKQGEAVLALFGRYVSQNILGMLGLSVYILADTMFIAASAGANGITALNLVLPVFNLIYAIGAMIGVGSATRYKILTAQQNPDAEHYFFNALAFTLLFSIPFLLVGIFANVPFLRLLGADDTIVETGKSYLRIILLFAPFFMWNHVFSAFVRNDNDPALAMTATFSSSIFNVVFDYILVFPAGLGMVGAALATALSPLVGISICLLHFRKPENQIHFRTSRMRLSFARLKQAVKLGFSAFVGEISSCVTTIVFNMLILGLLGNIGVAAYGVIANINLVCVAIFNGIAQGGQPLISDAYGKKNKDNLRRLLLYSAILAEILGLAMFLILNLFPTEISGFFNTEGNGQMTEYAVFGMHLYFIGLFFSGFNIVGSGYLSATGNAVWAFISSFFRGLVGIAVFAFLLAALFGMTGVWLAVPVTELLTALIVIFALRQKKKKPQREL